MKKTLLAAIIAATALVPPALAQDRGHHWGGGDRSGNSRGSQASPAPSPAPSSNRGGGSWNRSSQSQQSGQPQRSWNGGDTAGQWNRGGDRPQWNGGQRRGTPQTQYSAPQQQAQPQRHWDGNRERNNGGQWNRGNSGWNDRNRPSTNYSPPRNNGRSDWNRNSNRGWDGNRGYGNRGSWNNSWRNDHRYDWRGYRSTNRSLYRLPRYYAPSGWGYGYRRFSIGYTLSALLFAPQYWINDPFYYRLPDVYGPYRWVRYYNDALLVDVDTGEVVDVIYDIFW